MSSTQDLAKSLANDLITALTDTGGGALVETSQNLTPQLEAIVNAFPYFGEVTWNTAHRGTLSNLLENNLVTSKIAASPSAAYVAYWYEGSYHGYRAAFFPGLSLSAAASQLNQAKTGINWSSYATVILTDAIRKKTSISLDTSAIAAGLSTNATLLRPALSASVLACFEQAFSPTSQALNTIAAPQKSAAAAALDSAIKQGQFTANINLAISAGGASTSEATWFLFNLWITLMALGMSESEISTSIGQYAAAGLKIPPEVGASLWWSGGYTSWFSPLSGSDISPSNVTATMPETIGITTPSTMGGPPTFSTSQTSASNGYSQSFCLWGDQADYKVQHSSCFGRGTVVLLADGTTKKIEEIQRGDLVASSLGPRKVALIESPARNGRNLWQLNNQQLFATPGHPFRNPDKDGALRSAIDPWALVDGAPTMSKEGATHLIEGSSLLGQRKGNSVTATVSKVTRHEAPQEGSEKVYDLYLENWEVDHPSYYVGGPELYFAADSESSDPLHCPITTMAILAAMQIALPVAQRCLANAEAELLPLVNSLDRGAILNAARHAVYGGGKALSGNLELPGPEAYMQNGSWNSAASFLEFSLTRGLGRWLRSRSFLSWLGAPGELADGDHLVIVIHDLEVVGAAGLPTEAPLQLELQVEDPSLAASQTRSISWTTSESSRWQKHFDQALDLGRINGHYPSAIAGSMSCRGTTIGTFRAKAHFTDSSPIDIEDHFIFSTTGEVIGRIALSLENHRPTSLRHQSRPKKQCTRARVRAFAIHLGRQVGHRLAALIEEKATL